MDIVRVFYCVLANWPIRTFDQYICSKSNTYSSQLTVMCTTRGERRLIGFRCHKACMKGN